MRRRLAIVATHPIQYYAPWFQWIAGEGSIDLRVFFLSDFSIRGFHDRGFGREISWDTPLVDGYASEFVRNVASDPGTHHFRGLINPGLRKAVEHYAPEAVLLMAYKYKSIVDFLARWRKRGSLLLFRGDSHRIGRRSSIPSLLGLTVLFKRFDRFLYVGEANRDYYRKHGVPERKLFFAPHAVDNARFFAAAERASESRKRMRAAHGIPAEATVILFAGKLEHNKRPDLLVSAFRRLPAERNAILMIVGNGPLEDATRALAAGDSRIRFVPFQPQSAMPDVYAAADVTVLPSDSESWGLCINESFCMSVPAIVSSHVGCAPDLVLPETTGLIFRAGDADDLTSALLQATESRERMRMWGRAARDRIDGYSYARATEGLIAALQ